MLPFSNPLSDCILSSGHDGLGHAVDPDVTGDHLQRGQYAGLLHGPRERIVLVSDKPNARRSVLAPTAPHAGAVLEEREQPDLGSDVTLIVEDVAETDLPISLTC